MRGIRFFVAAVFLLGVTATALADFVDGGFGSGNLNVWTITPTTNGQTLVQTVGVVDIDGPGPLQSNNAGKFQVGQVVFQSGVPAGIELTQQLQLTGGVQYAISFNWAAIRDQGQPGNAEGGIFSLIVGGNALATQAAGSMDPNNPKYGFISANYTPGSSGPYVVGARITRPYLPAGGLYQWVDNFSAIPEPASLSLLALGAMALLRRR